MEESTSFGYWLRRRRKALDLTQAELARRVGCAFGTIRKLETDERRPSRELAMRLAQILAVPLEEQASFLQAARAERSVVQLALASQPLIAAAQSRQSHRTNNVPAPLTPLIGRADQVAAVRHALVGDQVRLMTLIGPPGIGKTRLGVQVATTVQDHFADGAYFVPLAPIADPTLVAPTIAHVLGVAEVANQSWLDRLKHTLHDKHLLLVLDNFEQVADAAPLVGELLQAAPRLKVLATSRVPLHIYGEYEFAVPPLTLPDLNRFSSVEELLRYEAIRLFNARAQAVKATFMVTAENAHAVAAICAHLDGLPLAIELAAARIKFFTPQALLERLTGANRHVSLRVLRSSIRDLPTRQQTLRGAIAWSYDLLDPEAQRLFRRLGVFVGGWTTAAAEVVCVSNGTGTRVETGLESLIDQSLIVQLAPIGHEPRCCMLETIREYALEQLTASREKEQVQCQHASFFLALAETAAAHLRGPDQVQWLNRLEADHDNFRAALSWTLDHGEAESGLRLAVALMRFWLAHAHLSEGRRWLERALVNSGGLPIALRAKALFEAGGLADQQGDHERQRVLQEASLALYQQLEDPLGIAAVLNCLGNTESDLVRARELHEESLRLYREQNDIAGIAKVLVCLAGDVGAQGNYEQERTLLEESLVLSKQLGDITGMGYALINLGCGAVKRGDHGQATAYLKESLALFQQLKDRRMIANCFTELAGAIVHEQPVRAVRLWGAARTLYQATGVILSCNEQSDDEHYQSAVRARVGNAAFANAWAEGRAMTLEQAVAYALEASGETDGIVLHERSRMHDIMSRIGNQ